jgi:predicted nuclease of predicted toxin-antitoxin system
VLTQDLDFTRLVAVSGSVVPSVVSLRLRSSRVEIVNAVLTRTLGAIEPAVEQGALVTIEDNRVRTRRLPVAP